MGWQLALIPNVCYGFVFWDKGTEGMNIVNLLGIHLKDGAI